MPRTSRRNLPGVTYHLIWRFVDRNWVLSDDEERASYLRFLGHALSRTDWRCISYALMSNHLHHAMIAGHDPMETWTKGAHSPFARWMNQRHGRLGPVFAERATDYGILPRNEAKLIAYIHNNPVRAGVVPRARNSSWTSHRAYTGLVVRPDWLHVDEGLRRAGFDSPAEFESWVDVTPGERTDLDVRTARQALRRRGAIAVASPTADGDEAMIPLVARPFAHVRPDPRRIIEIVGGLTCVPVARICSRQKHEAYVSARRVVVACALELGLTKSDIAAALGLSPPAIQKLAQRTLLDPELRTLQVTRERIELELWGSRNAG